MDYSFLFVNFYQYTKRYERLARICWIIRIVGITKLPIKRCWNDRAHHESNLTHNDRSRVCFHDGENLELAPSQQPT